MSTSLDRLAPTSVVDVVAVFDADFNQVFPDAAPMSASINQTATFFKHPLEDSRQRTDHIIFNPVEAVLTVVLTGAEYRQVYQQIKQIYNTQTALVFRTKVDTFENMYLQGMPHDETPENYDSVVVSLSLQETQFGTTVVTFQPANTEDTDTVDRGQQEPGEPTESQQQQGSTLFRIFS